MNVITDNKNYLFLKFKLKQIIRAVTRQKKLNAFGISSSHINSVFVINLDRQIERWKSLEKELKNISTIAGETLLNFSERFSAIDAKKDSLDTNKVATNYNLQDQYYVDPDPQLVEIMREKEISIDLTKQEVAVALSHISIWEKIVSENISNALILEDDVFFENNFSKKTNSIWKEITNSNIEFDLLFLSYKKVDRNPEINLISKNLSIPKRGIWWFSGYVLSNNGAKKLLEKLPVVGPIDLWINHKFEEIKVFLSNESIINQKLFMASDNNYSILPILSQIGIKSNKTFIDLDKLKGKNPVFIFDLNLNKDNLSNLNILLSLNSYRTFCNRSRKDAKHVSNIIANKQPFLFDAYIGFNTLINHLHDLISFYPNAVIILIKDDSKPSQELEFSNYTAKGIFLLNPKTKNICKQVSILLKIKSWDFDRTGIQYLSVNDIIKAQKIQISNDFKYLEHDATPWILPIQNMAKYLPNSYSQPEIFAVAKPVNGTLDYFQELDLTSWKMLQDTFPSNQADFKKENFSIQDDSGFEITINIEKGDGRQYSSASIVTQKAYLYGSFEIVMKPIKGDGIISAFFIHRNDPWQEIDIEFLGNDTKKVLVNVYFNPGFENAKLNYGVRGTPILIDLGFDASENFHTYKIEWEHHEIRWYVDDKIIHFRKIWSPTPIPNLPLHLYVNSWITNSEALAGKFKDEILPQKMVVKSVKTFEFHYDDN
jgi:GR25 family glycosyltransferase involved in LPS biosynthesis